MKTVIAEDAIHKFSSLLRSIAEGEDEEVLVMSRGQPVVRIIQVERSFMDRKRAHTVLLCRLKAQSAGGPRDWQRESLYLRPGK